MSLTAIFFVLLYFGGLLKALNGRPIFGLYTYLLAFYAHPISRWWGYSLPELRWSFIAAIATLMTIVFGSKNKTISIFYFKESKLFFFFTIFVVCQSLWAKNYELHQVYVQLVVKYIVLIFIVQNSIREPKDITGFIYINLLGCAYFGYLGLSSPGGRLEGVGGPGIESSNQLSQHLAVVLFFSSYLLFTKPGWKIIFLVPLIIICLNTIMLTQSRGAILAIALTGFVAVIYAPQNYKKQFYFLAALGGIAFGMLMGPQIVERFKSMKVDEDSGEMQDGSAQSRFVFIEAQIEMFKLSPLLGHGHRGTLILSPSFIDSRYLTSKDGNAVRGSHNFVMTLLVDHGLIGFLAYGLVIFYCLNRLVFLKKIKYYGTDKELDYLKLVMTGFSLGLLCFMISGLSSNHKVNEIDIWLYALIPLLHKQLMARKNDIEAKNLKESTK